jgi:hypothetical protein
MMPVGNLTKMVLSNTLRSPRHFILSAFGIVIGIGAFVLFLALTQKAGTVLEKVFPVEEVKVVAPQVSLIGKDASKKLDDTTVKTISLRPEVQIAIPRLALAFPSAGRGEFQGNDLRFQVSGFADGVDPSFVRDDERIRELFKDWDADTNDPNRIVLVDSPPLLLTSEARALASVCGQIVLVVRAGTTPQQAVFEALQMLGEGRSIGIVLNGGSEEHRRGYYGYYGEDEANQKAP